MAESSVPVAQASPGQLPAQKAAQLRNRQVPHREQVNECRRNCRPGQRRVDRLAGDAHHVGDVKDGLAFIFHLVNLGEAPLVAGDVRRASRWPLLLPCLP